MSRSHSFLKTLSIGHVSHDIYGTETCLGGSAYYAGKTFRMLGAQSCVYTTVGCDFQFENELKDLEISVQRKGSTTSFTNLYDQTGARIQFVRARAPDIDLDGIPNTMRTPDILLVCPVLAEVDLQSALSHIQAKLVGVALQGYLRKIDESITSQSGPKRVMSSSPQLDMICLKRVDVVCLSEDDLAGQADLLGFVRQHVKFVALTRGKMGCELFYAGNHIALDAVAVDLVVDPTGAGDCFTAGLLCGLASGHTAVEAAMLGMACSSIVIQAKAGGALHLIRDAWSLLHQKS